MSLALAWGVRASVGFCLGAAAVGKMLEFRSFTRTVRLLLGTNEAVARALGIAVVVVECCVGLYLVSSFESLAGDVVAISWLASLVAVSTVAWLRRLDVPCSCFGASAGLLGEGLCHWRWF